MKERKRLWRQAHKIHLGVLESCTWSEKKRRKVTKNNDGREKEGGTRIAEEKGESNMMRGWRREEVILRQRETRLAQARATNFYTYVCAETWWRGAKFVCAPRCLWDNSWQECVMFLARVTVLANGIYVLRMQALSAWVFTVIGLRVFQIFMRFSLIVSTKWDAIRQC